ncbi:MAG: HIT domain-containing protein [Patescibacteria group bacterium]
MTDCIFCQIAAKKLSAKIEYEDQEIIAFDDIAPKAPIHILIIPKKHLESVNHLKAVDSKLVGKLVLAAQKIAKEKKIDRSGYRLVFNTGPDSGQIVPHLHLHLLGGGKL